MSSKTIFGYVIDVTLLNNRPKNEDPSEILTCPINSWVAGSWYVDVAVNLATTLDWAPIITSLSSRSNKPGVDW